METLHSLPWRLLSLIAAAIIILLFVGLTSSAKPRMAKWTRGTWGGRMLYTAFAILFLSSVIASFTSPLPPFGDEYEREQTRKVEVAQLQANNSNLTAELASARENLQIQTERLIKAREELLAAETEIRSLKPQIVPVDEREKISQEEITYLRAEVALEKEPYLRAEVAFEKEQRRNIADRLVETQSAVQALESQLELPTANPEVAVARLADNANVDLTLGYGALNAAAFERGELKEAAEYYKQLAARADEVGYLPGAALAYANLAVVYDLQGDPDQASAAHKMKLERLRDLGIQETNMTSMYNELGITDRIRENLEEAKSFHSDVAMNLAEEYSWGKAAAAFDTGVIAYIAGDLKESRQKLEEASGVFGEYDYKLGEIMTYRNLTIVYADLAAREPDAERRKELDAEAAAAREKQNSVMQGLQQNE